MYKLLFTIPFISYRFLSFTFKKGFENKLSYSFRQHSFIIKGSFICRGNYFTDHKINVNIFKVKSRW